MALNYASLAATALKLIGENGKNVTIRKSEPAVAVDALKPWRTDTANTFAVVVKAVEHPYTQYEVDDKVITKGDTRLYVAADAFELAAAAQDVAAAQTLTLTNQPVHAETVAVGGKVYTFETVLTNVDGRVLIGATTEDSLDHLVAAVNLGAGAGTPYAALTTLHPTVSATDGTGLTVVFTAKTAGVAGNAITTTETLTFGSFGGVTLAGGYTVSRALEDYNFVTFASEKWRIMKANPIRPAEIVVLYDLQCRR